MQTLQTDTQTDAHVQALQTQIQMVAHVQTHREIHTRAVGSPVKSVADTHTHTDNSACADSCTQTHTETPGWEEWYVLAGLCPTRPAEDRAAGLQPLRQAAAALARDFSLISCPAHTLDFPPALASPSISASVCLGEAAWGSGQCRPHSHTTSAVTAKRRLVWKRGRFVYQLL